MKTTLLVLWLFSASGWNVGGMHLGPGWFPTKNLFLPDFEASCLSLGKASVAAMEAVTKFGCWPNGDGPPIHEWSELIKSRKTHQGGTK